MKTQPTDSRGQHHKMDAGEQGGHGSTGPEVKGKTDLDKGDDGMEYDENGKQAKGGGYYKKGGKLYKMGPMHKSDVAADDLQKSLDMLEEFSNQEDPMSRKQELLSKAMNGDINAEENTELIQLMGGAEPQASAEPTAADRITKSLTDNEPLSKALDVSDYLRDNHDALTKSLTAIGEELEKSDHRRHQFSLILAKAVKDIGDLVKADHDILMQLAGAPARAPMSAGVRGGRRPGPAPLNKSFAGQTPPENQLTKPQVLNALEYMNKSMDRVGSESVSLALTKYESSNMISPNMLAAVKQHIAGTQQAAH